MKSRGASIRGQEGGPWATVEAASKGDMGSAIVAGRPGIGFGERETGKVEAAGPCIGSHAREMGKVAAERPSVRRSMRSPERGEGKVKAIIVTAILVFAIYAAIKIVPPYAAEYQLADKMQEQARFAIVNHYTDEQIRENVFKVVQDLEIPVKKEDIKVEASNQIVKIAMDYTVPIDLLAYHMDLHFTPSSENKSLF